MNDTATILVVDDDREMVNLLCDVLSEAGYTARSANSAAEALARVREDCPDLVISDVRMSGMSGHELQNELRELVPDLPVVIITAFGSIESAVESMKLGAADYITKPFRNDQFLVLVARVLENIQLRQEIRRLRGDLARSYGIGTIIAADPKMKAVLRKLEQFVDTNATVVITGESGTGKDLLARALHFESRRRDAPFVPVNCAALPDNLIESELFGYARGAFTDARQSKLGLFQAARGGTLFLDEISEMPYALQAKLLRVIEDKKVRPLGATEETPIDVRIVAATNTNLDKAIADGKFRADLFYRLATFTLSVPPLRERRDDIPLLIKHFLVRASAEAGKPIPIIEPEAMDFFMSYRWPGNVRELQSAIQSGVILSRQSRLTVADLPASMTGAAAPTSNLLEDAVARKFTLERVEQQYARMILESVGGNKTEAAAILKIDRKTLYRKLGEYVDED
ncbi:MAG TPA: sigma-54 dependent transcriptional regulator [Candidatus Binataceae bacterium]|nr:sigma-54 dependent transcriptional regulator [Candidatus Binataceae bacterium]